VSFGSLSFYNQNRNWQIEQQRWSDMLNSSNAVNSALSAALTSQSAGLAAISNQRALSRVNAQLKAAATNVVNGLSPTQLAQLQASATASQSTSSSLKTTQASSSAASSLNLLA
jgi:ribosomal protein S3